MSAARTPTVRERAIAARRQYGDDRDAGVVLARIPADLFETLVTIEDQDAVHWRTRRSLLAERDALVVALEKATRDISLMAQNAKLPAHCKTELERVAAALAAAQVQP